MRTVLLGIASCLTLSIAANAAPRVDYLELLGKAKEAEKAFDDAKSPERYLQDIRSSLPTFGEADQGARERLQRVIDDLLERAKKANLAREPFWELQAQIIDAKCSTAIRDLWLQMKQRHATVDQFERVADLYRQRAEAAKEHPDFSKMVQEQIDKLKKRYLASESISPWDTSMVDDATIVSMLDRGLAWLEDMAVKRHATREQFEYVRDLMKQRARNFSENVEWRGLMQRVDAELDRLMNRDLSSSGFGRDDFAKLREMCMTKAEGAYGKPAPNG